MKIDFLQSAKNMFEALNTPQAITEVQLANLLREIWEAGRTSGDLEPSPVIREPSLFKRILGAFK